MAHVQNIGGEVLEGGVSVAKGADVQREHRGRRRLERLKPEEGLKVQFCR